MNYSKVYESLIHRARGRDNTEGYFENHHVIPKCIGGSDDSDNLVKLTPEEHYVAHQLLHKMYPDNYGLLMAVSLMTVHTTEGRASNKTFGWIRRKTAQAISERWKTEHPRGMAGKTHNDITKQKISALTSEALVKRIGVRVNMFDMSGNFVREFKTLSSAAEHVNTSPSNIKNCCEGKFGQIKGFLWSYSDTPNIPKSPRGPKKVSVNGNVFQTVSECATAHGFSSTVQVRRRCLSDKYPKWKYLTGVDSA